MSGKGPAAGRRLGDAMPAIGFRPALPPPPFSMFANPRHNTVQIGLAPGMTVADFGSGSGFYALAAAEAVGRKGKVYAVDIQKDLLGRLKNEAERAGLRNVEVVWGNIERPRGSSLPDRSVDAVIISNVLFELSRRAACAIEANRILRPGGRVLVVEWRPSAAGAGPRPEHRLSRSDIESLFFSQGFTREKEIEAGSHHYGIIMKKPEET